jgi:hypothetical protein
MIEDLYEQRIAELEFRVTTLETAVLSMLKTVSVLERFYNAGSQRLLDDILGKESKQ